MNTNKERTSYIRPQVHKFNVKPLCVLSNNSIDNGELLGDGEDMQRLN